MTGNVFSLLFLAMLWSPSFLFIKFGLEGFPPVTLAMLRLALAAGVMYGSLRLSGHSLPRTWAAWRPFVVMGLVANAIPFSLFCLGETQAESGPAAILNSTTPIFTVVLAHAFLHEEQLSAARLTGVGIGFLGIVVLFYPELRGGFLESGRFWGYAGFTMASLCYGFSTVYARRNLLHVPARVSSAAQLVCAAMFLVPVSLIVERPFSSRPGWGAMGAVVWLAVIGTALAYTFYYDLLQRTSATFVSMVTYIIPPVGVLLGAVFLQERVGWNHAAGCALILAGVMVVNGLGRRAARWVLPPRFPTDR